MATLSLTASHAFPAAADSSAYLLCLEADAEELTLVAATSERSLVAFDRRTLTRVCDIGPPASKGGVHTARINELCFAARTLYSASSDGTVRAWDPLSQRAAPTMQLAAGDGDEVWCVSAQNAGHLLAAGTESGVLVWDVRKPSAPLARYEVHTEAVTQV